MPKDNIDAIRRGAGLDSDGARRLEGDLRELDLTASRCTSR